MGEIAKAGRPTAKSSCCVVFEGRRIKGVHDSASGRRGCKAAGYPCKVRENKLFHTDRILPFLAAERPMRFALIRLLV